MSTVHVRLWDRRGPEFAGPGFGQGLFLDAYETLIPEYHRQTLYLDGTLTLRTTDTTTELGSYSDLAVNGQPCDPPRWYYYLKIDHSAKTAVVFHNAGILHVVYEEALQTVQDLKAHGFQ